MASREEIQHIVIDRIDGIYGCRKDRNREPKAFVRTCEAYFGAFQDTPSVRLAAAIERTVADFEGPFWPTPAVIRRHMPEESQGPAAWTAMPARWKWDNRLPELRRLCRWDSQEDPLVALANGLARTSTTDPWLTMRNAMITKAGPGVWEKFGDENYPAFSVEHVKVTRALVEKAGRTVGVTVDLSALPLDQADACIDVVTTPHERFF